MSTTIFLAKDIYFSSFFRNAINLTLSLAEVLNEKMGVVSGEIVGDHGKEFRFPVVTIAIVVSCSSEFSSEVAMISNVVVVLVLGG